MAGLIKIEDLKDQSVSMLWSSIIAARKMPKPFSQLNPISFIKGNSGSMFVLDSDISNFVSSCKKIESIQGEKRKEIVSNMINEWIKKYISAEASIRDLKELNFSSFSNETLYKIYSIIISQGSDVMNIYYAKKFLLKSNSGIFNEIENALSNNNISDSSILSLRNNLFQNELFNEIGKRIYKRLDEVLLMSPEEMHSSLYGGVFDDELEERKSNYIIVYDLEKDAPHIYSGEKARAMEANLFNSH